MRPVGETQKRWASIFEGPIGVDLRTSVRDGDGSDPCESGLRSVCWKSFLLYGPVSQTTWPKKLAESRSVYASLRDHYLKFIDHPDSLYSTADPLADDETSPWSTLRQDEEARAEILQDVVRTYQDNYFFKEPETQRRLLDILFIFAKLNPDTGYRQGMHELLATLLWAVQEDAVSEAAVLPADRERDGARLMIDTLNARWVEADAFTLFCAVMQSVKSSYETGEHGEAAPIIERSRRIHEELLATYDPELAQRLQVIGVLPQIYAIRWIRLLFARELEFKQTLRLWDILFAENIQTSIVDLTCVAILLRIRWSLVDADYSTAITKLTRVHIPPSGGDADARSLVRDALLLERNKSQEAGADLIQASSGRRPKAQRSDGLAKDRLAGAADRGGLRTAQYRQSGSPSPARFSSPQRQLENLFQNVSSGIQQRTEGWNVSRAVRSAVGEVRKNVNSFQAHSRQGSADLVWRDYGRDDEAANASSKTKQLERKLHQLEARNKALAKMLDGALESLRSMNDGNGGNKDTRDENFNVSLARIQFVSVYLSDSEIPIPGGDPDADTKQAGQGTKGHHDGGDAADGGDDGDNDDDDAHPPMEPGAPTQGEPSISTDAKQEQDETTETRQHGGGQRPDEQLAPSRSPVAKTKEESGSQQLRPSLTDSPFSFMLGEDRHRSTFISSVADLPEQRRDSRTSESKARPKQLWAEQQQPKQQQQQQKETAKNVQGSGGGGGGGGDGDDDGGFSLSSLRRGNRA